MRKIRILAIIDLIIIAGLFAVLVAALFTGKNDLFFISGSVLVAALILGFVLRSAAKRIREEADDLPVNREGPDE